ncbi:MAG: hypothetical protein Q9173_003315 [Seirophora scorigena]
MGQTNIRKASGLLLGAGSTSENQVIIQPFGIGAYTVYIPSFSQELVNKYIKLLNHGLEEQWLSHVNNPMQTLRVLDPSQLSSIPKVCISGAVKDTSSQQQQPKASLDYLLIVQGNNASERSKTVVERSLEDVVTSILHEAMNRCSTVFTGTLLRSDMNEVFSPMRSFKLSCHKMPDVAALIEIPTKRSSASKEIGIIF